MRDEPPSLIRGLHGTTKPDVILESIDKLFGRLDPIDISNQSISTTKICATLPPWSTAGVVGENRVSSNGFMTSRYIKDRIASLEMFLEGVVVKSNATITCSVLERIGNKHRQIANQRMDGTSSSHTLPGNDGGQRHEV